MVLVWPLATLLGAARLCVIAPRRVPGTYLGPAAGTVALITLAVTYVAAIWSH